MVKALLADLRGKFDDLVPVQQELAGPSGVVVELAGGPVGGDVGIDQPHLAVLGAGVGVAKVGASARMDLISVPVRTKPASYRSSIS